MYRKKIVNKNPSQKPTSSLIKTKVKKTPLVDLAHSARQRRKRKRNGQQRDSVELLSIEFKKTAVSSNSFFATSQEEDQDVMYVTALIKEISLFINTIPSELEFLREELQLILIKYENFINGKGAFTFHDDDTASEDDIVLLVNFIKKYEQHFTKQNKLPPLEFMVFVFDITFIFTDYCEDDFIEITELTDTYNSLNSELSDFTYNIIASLPAQEDSKDKRIKKDVIHSIISYKLMYKIYMEDMDVKIHDLPEDRAGYLKQTLDYYNDNKPQFGSIDNLVEFLAKKIQEFALNNYTMSM